MPRRRQAEPLGRSLTGARRSSDSGIAQPPLKNGVLDEINATAKTQFPRRVRFVHLDGLHAEPQLRRDFLVGVADGHQLQNFALAVGDARPGSRAVLCHHERADGRGYPNELHGEEVPLLSRIVQICDAWVAMTDPESYQPPQRPEDAMTAIRGAAGGQFDAALAASFAEMRNLRRGGP